MTPRRHGELVIGGVVGRNLDLAAAKEAAGLAAGNAVTALVEAVGLAGIVRALSMTVYVVAVDGFTAHSAVADGASAVLRERLGERGTVARSAGGGESLPAGAPGEGGPGAARRMRPPR